MSVCVRVRTACVCVHSCKLLFACGLPTPQLVGTAHRVGEEVMQADAQEKRSADVTVGEVPVGCLLVWESAEDRQSSDIYQHTTRLQQ